MALILRSSRDVPHGRDYDQKFIRYQAYNALDGCLTVGVFDEMSTYITPETERVYAFERAMQGPAMTLQGRGIRIDEQARAKAVAEVEASEKKLETILNRIAHVWWGKPINPRSAPQLKEFLYNTLGLPEQKDHKTHKVSTGIDALETLKRSNPKFWSIFACILGARAMRKQLGFLNAKRSPDGRVRASFNVGATETGRWSSSANCYKEGLNYQNVFKKLRYIYVPDPGLIMGNADLAQAESRLVAYLSGDQGYIDAHLSLDTHTHVAKLVWPDVHWPGGPCTMCHDDPALRAVCKGCGHTGSEDVRISREPNFFRHFSRRDLAKRVQHGTNYGATEYMLARVLNISLSVAREILGRYKRAFPGIFGWQEDTKKELLLRGALTTPLGRTRQFYGRVWDGPTQREAIAHVPQSMVGDILNVGLYRIWRKLDGNGLWILNQGHDSILFQLDPSRKAELLPQVTKLMEVPFYINGQLVTIPADVGTGPNWLAASE